MELSFSQTPNRVWWALEASATSISLTQRDDLRSPPATPLHPSGPDGKDGRELGASNFVFYDYVDETDSTEDKEELEKWLKGNRNRGLVR